MNKQHIPALDSLRGIAALIVVVSHSANAGFLPGFLGSGFGQVGVVAFYALSGFLMVHLYFDRPFDRSTVTSYFLSRMGRVLPLYYAAIGAWVLAFMLLGISAYGTFEFERLVDHILLIKGQSVFWSIPIEVHFYLLFVLIWGAVATTRSPWLVLMSLWAASAVFSIWFAPSGVANRWIVFWLHIFLAGGLIALAKRALDVRGLSYRWHRWGGISAYLLLVAAVMVPPQIRLGLGLSVRPTPIDAVSVGFPILVLIACVFRLGPFARLDFAITRWLGRISFGVYLIHRWFIGIADRLSEQLDTIWGGQFLFVLGGTVLVAELSQRFIEAPSLKWFKTLSYRRGTRQTAL